LGRSLQAVEKLSANHARNHFPCSFSPRWNRNGRASAVEDHQIFLERFAKV